MAVLLGVIFEKKIEFEFPSSYIQIKKIFWICCFSIGTPNEKNIQYVGSYITPIF